MTGSVFAMFTATGLSRDGEIMLFTNPRLGDQSLLHAIVASRRSKRGEVAGERGGRGNKGGVLGAVRAQRGSLKTAEEEELVPETRQNGTADNTAELISLQSIARERKEVAGVQISVPQEFEQIAVIFVGAGFGDGIDRRGRVEPILRRRRAGLHLEFLQSVRERQAAGSGCYTDPARSTPSSK